MSTSTEETLIKVFLFLFLAFVFESVWLPVSETVEVKYLYFPTLDNSLFVARILMASTMLTQGSDMFRSLFALIGLVVFPLDGLLMLSTTLILGADILRFLLRPFGLVAFPDGFLGNLSPKKERLVITGKMRWMAVS